MGITKQKPFTTRFKILMVATSVVSSICLGPLSEGPSSCYKEPQKSHVCKKKGNLSKRYAAILGYQSLEEVKQIIDSSQENKFTLCKLLETYDPRLSLEQLQPRIDHVLDRTQLPGHWEEGPDFQINKTWLLNLTHLLWVEKNAGLPWSLKNYTKDNIQFLLPNRLLEKMPAPPLDIKLRYRDPLDRLHSKRLTFIETETYKLMPFGIFLSSSNQLESVSNIIDWETKNVFHTVNEWTGKRCYKDYPGFDWSVPLELLLRERVVGCGLSSSLAVAIARSINIPAEVVTIDEHRAAWFPSINRIVHGDNIAFFAAPPPGSLLLTPEQLCSMDNIRNSGRGYYFSPNPKVLLGREKNSLHVFGNYPIRKVYADQQYHLTPEFYALFKRLREFNPRFVWHETNPGIVKLESDRVKIMGLDELRSLSNRPKK
jgi:hypothetical protein